jgi:hypothetical protein
VLFDIILVVLKKMTTTSTSLRPRHVHMKSATVGASMLHRPPHPTVTAAVGCRLALNQLMLTSRARN